MSEPDSKRGSFPRPPTTLSRPTSAQRAWRYCTAAPTRPVDEVIRPRRRLPQRAGGMVDSRMENKVAIAEFIVALISIFIITVMASSLYLALPNKVTHLIYHFCARKSPSMRIFSKDYLRKRPETRRLVLLLIIIFARVSPSTLSILIEKAITLMMTGLATTIPGTTLALRAASTYWRLIGAVIRRLGTVPWTADAACRKRSLPEGRTSARCRRPMGMPRTAAARSSSLGAESRANNRSLSEQGAPAAGCPLPVVAGHKRGSPGRSGSRSAGPRWPIGATSACSSAEADAKGATCRSV